MNTEKSPGAQPDLLALRRATPAGALHGSYHADFTAVVDEFERNFAAREEVGASLCITLEGRVVVDVWGGRKSLQSGDPWQEDTISVIFSSTKGAVALAAHTLISAGELDLNAPVKKYWPEFAVNGKEQVTVRMMLDHSAGVPAVREKLRDDGCRDWAYMTDKVAAEAPFWKPGSRHGYHMMTFGWTVGELIRRVSGQSLGSYFAEAVADPTGAECWIGLPDTLQDRVAPVIPFRPQKGAPLGEFTRALVAEPKSLQALAFYNNGGFSPNNPRCHAAEIGGGGGIANGRGLAKIYAPFACGGELHGRRFVDTDTLAAMSQVSSASHEDATLLLPTRFSLGFMKSMDNRQVQAVSRDSVILGADAFGHVGAGGSIGFADPRARMSFGYTMNRMGPGILMNERGQALVDAAYQALGCRGNRAGVWC